MQQSDIQLLDLRLPDRNGMDLLTDAKTLAQASQGRRTALSAARDSGVSRRREA